MVDIEPTTRLNQNQKTHDTFESELQSFKNFHEKSTSNEANSRQIDIKKET